MNKIAVICIAIASAIFGTTAYSADTYPQRPVRLITPYAPGGNADIQARYIAAQLTDLLKEQVVVDNRPGANGIIGMDLAARAPADGHTILLVASGFAVNPSLGPKLPYDTIKDFQPISLVGDTPLLFVTSNRLGASSVKEVIALARSSPGKLNYASSGNGSPASLAGALFRIMTDTDIVHVPYRGTAASLVEVISGQIQMAFPSITSVLRHVKAGRVKALAITIASRSALAPDLPTMTEAGLPGFEASIWNGLLAPSGTPKPIVNRLNQTIVQFLKSPQAKERYKKVGVELVYNSPEEFETFIKSEITKWAEVIDKGGLRVDQR